MCLFVSEFVKVLNTSVFVTRENLELQEPEEAAEEAVRQALQQKLEGRER